MDTSRLPLPRMRDVQGLIAPGVGSVERRVFAAVRERGVPVSAFGIAPDGNIDGALQRAFDARASADASSDPWRRGSPILLPPGKFYATQPLVADFSDGNEQSGDHFAIEGAGHGRTVISWRAATDGSSFISYLGGISGSQPHALLEMKGFFLVNDGLVTNKAIRIEKAAFFSVQDIYTQGFDLHWDLVDCLSAKFMSCDYRFGRRGVWARRGSFSHPNALTFIACVSALMDEWGEVLENPATYARLGGSIEGNGLSSKYAARGGLALSQPGTEGNVAATIDGVYFENNGGLAHLLCEGIQPRGSVAVNVRSSFNLASELLAPAYAVLARTGPTDPSLIVNIAGSGFGHFNDYVSSASRPYIAATGQARIVGAAQCSYAANVQRPQGVLDAFASCIFDGRGSGDPVNRYTDSVLSNVVSINKIATGVFKINFRARGVAPYQVGALYVLPGVLPPVVQTEDENSITLNFFNATGAPVDPFVRLRID